MTMRLSRHTELYTTKTELPCVQIRKKRERKQSASQEISGWIVDCDQKNVITL